MNTWKEKILAIFAETGNIQEVPVDAQADNRVSFETGYTNNYDKEKAQAESLVVYGVEIEGFNYLLKIITSAIKELQETIPTYTTDVDEQKVDIAAITENTVAFSALTELLCIDDTGKANKITKEELIAQLNPNIDLSSNNITVSEIADTALNNFLAIDGTTIKKAGKLLQEVIEEIDLSANNVTISQETTYDNVHKVLVTNTAGTTLKTDKLPQEIINNINLSASNVSVEHTHTAGTTLKPLMIDENGSIKSEDTISSDIIKGDIYAKGFKTIVITKEQYPNGIDDLKETGLYSLVSMDEYKDIINNNLPSERKEYVKSVLTQILTLLDYPSEELINLDITKFSDLTYCPMHQIQVVGVSQGETDNTTVQQTFVLFGMMLGTRTGTVTLTDVEFNDIIRTNGLSYLPITVEKSNISDTTVMSNVTIIDLNNPITSYNEITKSGYYIIMKQLTETPLEGDSGTFDTGILQVINTGDKMYTTIGINGVIQIQYLLPTHKTTTNYPYLQTIANMVPIQYPVFKFRYGTPASLDGEGELTFQDWVEVNEIKSADSLNTQITKETDLNNITTAGRYLFLNNLDTVTNKPTEFNRLAFILEVDNLPYYDEGVMKILVAQVVYDLTNFDFNITNKIKYHRIQTNTEQNTWSNWQKKDVDLSIIGSVSETTTTANKILVKDDNGTIKDITLSDFINNFVADYAIESSRKLRGISNVDLETQTEGVLSISKGGTGVTTITELQQLVIPVGFIYFHLRGQQPPDYIFGNGGKWQDVSNTYAGEFFRVIGGNSSVFGITQPEGLPNIIGETSANAVGKSDSINSHSTGAFLPVVSRGSGTGAGENNLVNSVKFRFNAAVSNPIYGASAHVTPYNSAIRIWKKIS